jgi:NADH-quinone oxidoreductase subunit C
MAQKVLDALIKKFGDAIEESTVDLGEEVAYVKRGKLVEVATWLRDEPTMAFNLPVFCTCIDLLGQEPRFELCYQIRSLVHRHSIRLKVRLAEEDVKSPSLADVWAGFGWLERETYDMYGIEFQGHPDLRRIYMYEEFIGYPLRKDYPKEKRQPLVRRDDLPRD